MDILKFIAIFLVLWGHAIQHLLPEVASGNSLFRFISSFHMALFMCIAGFFATSSRPQSTVRLIVRRAEELVLPALVAGVILVVLKWLLYTNNYNTASAKTDYLAGFWFLKSLFICYALYLPSVKAGRWRIPILVAALLISQCIGFCGVNRMFPFFLSGICLRLCYPWLQRHSLTIAILSGVCFAAALSGWDESFFGRPGGFHPLLNYLRGTNEGYLRFIVYPVVIGMAGSLFCISTVETLSPLLTKLPFIDIISHAGQKTKGIYIVQVLILEIIMPRFVSAGNLDTVLFDWVVSPAIACGMLMVSLLIVKVLEQNPLVSYLTLGNRKKR